MNAALLNFCQLTRGRRPRLGNTGCVMLSLGRLKRVGMPGRRDRHRTLIARFSVRRFLSKCCGVQDRSQGKQTDDSHGFILPLYVP
jgi:hypothetical protein